MPHEKGQTGPVGSMAGSAIVRLPCMWCQGRGVLDFGRGEGDCPHCDCGEVDVTPAEVAEMELYEEDIRRGLDPGQNSFFKRSNCGDCDPCLGGRADQCAIFPSPNTADQRRSPE